MRHRPADGSMDLVQLRTFLAVYRTGSLTAGAAQAGLSQPTVTTQVQADRILRKVRATTKVSAAMTAAAPNAAVIPPTR
ncbi:LysR family transcriptional regulator, partial [Nocardia sp. NPDC003648]